MVHGGPDHYRPERVTTALLGALDRLTPLAPLHEPHNIAPIRAIAAARPNLPQVACFDTAFHHTMPKVATRFALPREYEDAGVRRYGFHGLSYEYIAGRLCEVAPDLAKGRVIAAHLGNGASLCAMLDGQSVDTTMGFTALDGLVMGTRSGSLDPGVISLSGTGARPDRKAGRERCSMNNRGCSAFPAGLPATCAPCSQATIPARRRRSSCLSTGSRAKSAR